jgi:hypothetical protein
LRSVAYAATAALLLLRPIRNEKEKPPPERRTS